MVLNKPFRSSINAWMMEIDNCQCACNMIDVIDRLSDGEVKRAFSVIRMDPDKPTREFDKWCVLLDSRAHSNGELREDGKSSNQGKVDNFPDQEKN